MKQSQIECITFLGIKINTINYSDIFEIIREKINGRHYICLTDVNNIINASNDEQFHRAINESLMSIADGMPLAWYGKLVGFRRIERISGLELMRRVLEDQNEFKHFLLGDTNNTISRIIRIAKQVNPKIHIKGYSPPFKDKFNELDNEIIFDKINNEKSDIIWVSFGGGKQDKWMHNNINKLNRGVMIGVGAAFRFYTGDILTPPKLIQKLGFQWFSRTLQQPRMLKKQLKSFPIFMFHFPWELIKARMRSRKYCA